MVIFETSEKFIGPTCTAPTNFRDFLTALCAHT